ncbi:MAG: protein-glutamate O-methyltransferase CheR, partial [Desulfobulbaceae bacterium]|nr:protein-glutamate O-methyltransferase CheR [Desulfobulbaceae bacterium]
MNNEDIEIMALLKAVRLKYGYDFSQYAGASLTRRIKKCLVDSGLKYISEMIPLIIYRKAFFDTFLNNFTVNVTEMFRDPLFFLSIRKKVVPYLHTYPFIKVWSVGVSTGEEVYSLAILLKEEGLY